MSKALWMRPDLDTGIEHPEHVKNCAAALAWLVKNAAERKLDPRRISLHSADGVIILQGN